MSESSPSESSNGMGRTHASCRHCGFPEVTLSKYSATVNNLMPLCIVIFNQEEERKLAALGVALSGERCNFWSSAPNILDSSRVP